jgi:PTS system mannose-specific IIB component|uniref:PTS mannose/fructose/sorbose transporter subunit IIB n=1 Tax=candidate division WOR-3 bacterium TaxID=2052148 RepID=A0A7V3RG79_UNCW3
MFILRIDDRLIHGQVVAGWARPLGIEELIIASDTISQDAWVCSAYRLAVPENITFHCFDIAGCVQHLKNGMEKKRIMVVVEKPADAYNLVKSGLQVKEVYVGGLGYKENARPIAHFIYLTPEDINALVKLHELGIKVIGKQLPNSQPIDVIKKLTGV